MKTALFALLFLSPILCLANARMSCDVDGEGFYGRQKYTGTVLIEFTSQDLANITSEISRMESDGTLQKDLNASLVLTNCTVQGLSSPIPPESGGINIVCRGEDKLLGTRMLGTLDFVIYKNEGEGVIALHGVPFTGYLKNCKSI